MRKQTLHMCNLDAFLQARTSSICSLVRAVDRRHEDGEAGPEAAAV